MAIDFPNSPSPGATFTANSKTWTFTNGKWALNVSVGGVTGPAGVAIQGTAPATTDILWVDTSDTGLVIVPVGGTTGQVLAKSSGTDYATTWATPVTSGDMALKADLASPTFTGTPTLPTGTIATTQTALDSSTKVATTAFVTSADALKADLASPTFTGTPTLPSGTIATTQTAGNSSTAVATTAFVGTAVANLVDSAPATLNTLDELALALGDDANFATTTATAIGLKAPIASPTFTGTPTLPTGTIATTQSAGNNTTAVATTAFVTEAIPVGVINPYAGSSAPSGWLLCYGQSTGILRSTYSALFAVIGTTYGAGDGTTTFNLPDLRGRAIAGVDNMGGTAASRLTSTVLSASNTLGATGGTQTHTMSSAEMPSHTHTQNSHNHTQDSHNHSQNPHGHDFDRLDGYNSYTGVSNRVIGVQGGGALGGYVLPNTATNIATTATNQAATAVNQSTGSGSAHLNTQPTMVLNYIIKAL